MKILKLHEDSNKLLTKQFKMSQKNKKVDFLACCWLYYASVYYEICYQDSWQRNN